MADLQKTLRDIKAAPRSADRPRAKREDPEVRRQKLLDAAVVCLARVGPHGTTGREICRQAGVSHSLIRHYFGNPQALLLEAYKQLCGQFLDRFESDVAAAGDDPWLALDRFFALHFSTEWAGSDVLGAWIGFWTLIRGSGDFAAERERFNVRLTALLTDIVARIPKSPAAPAITDTVLILGGVMDGLWLEIGLSPTSLHADRAVALCNAAARRVLTD